MPTELTEMQKRMVGPAADRIYDNEALTISDLMNLWKCGWRLARERVKEKLESGEWEVAYRNPSTGRDVPGFRIKR